MSSVSLINGHIDPDDDYKSCEDCISFEVCHAVKLSSKMMHADVLCEHFIDKDLIEKLKEGYGSVSCENEWLRAHLKQIETQGSETMHSLCEEIRALKKTVDYYKAENERLYQELPIEISKALANKMKEKVRVFKIADGSRVYDLSHITLSDIDDVTKELVGAEE